MSLSSDEGGVIGCQSGQVTVPGMLSSTLPDRLAYAWAGAVRRLADSTPKGWYAERGAAAAVVSGSLVASLNVAHSMSPEPDLRALDEMAAEVARTALPWSIIVRANAAEPAAELAARYGLTEHTAMPLTACPAAGARLVVDAARAGAVQAVGAESSGVYSEALARAFEVPEEVFGSLMDGAVLDEPGFTGYLARAGGQPVATGLGVVVDGTVGVFNIGVHPRQRGSGLGRAVTVRVLADGFAAGADVAYLHPSEAGRRLYESIGFRDVEAWAMYTAPGR